MDTTEANDLVEPGSVDPGHPTEPVPGSRKDRRRGRHGRKRRWPKRVAIAFVSIVLLIAAAIGLTYAYATHKLGEFHHVVVQHPAPPAPPGKPFNVLLVGSDSRQFVDTPAQEKQFGNPADQTGQRSDVIIIARFIPAAKRIILLSIPRDTFVTIPGKVPNVSGPNRINVAFDTGSPSLLIETIEDVFQIPINHYVAVNFEGFSDMVNALGGVYLNFPVPVKDTVSDLNVTKTGCQLVQGPQALALVRSRDLQYETPSGWQYDVQGDFSRIRRQDAFFQSLISKANGASPFTLNDFLTAAQKNQNVSIDQNLVGQRPFEPGEPVQGDHGQGSHHRDAPRGRVGRERRRRLVRRSALCARHDRRLPQAGSHVAPCFAPVDQHVGRCDPHDVCTPHHDHGPAECRDQHRARAVEPGPAARHEGSTRVSFRAQPNVKS